MGRQSFKPDPHLSPYPPQPLFPASSFKVGFGPPKRSRFSWCLAPTFVCRGVLAQRFSPCDFLRQVGGLVKQYCCSPPLDGLLRKKTTSLRTKLAVQWSEATSEGKKGAWCRGWFDMRAGGVGLRTPFGQGGVHPPPPTESRGILLASSPGLGTTRFQ